MRTNHNGMFFSQVAMMIRDHAAGTRGIPTAGRACVREPITPLNLTNVIYGVRALKRTIRSGNAGKRPLSQLWTVQLKSMDPFL